MSDDLFPTEDVSSAVLSPCGTYRYSLTRSWNDPIAQFRLCPVLFIGLNPSIADATINDPTIRRCIGFAKRWGFKSLVMCNLFGYRDTDPRGLRCASDPIGPENDGHLMTHAFKAGRIIAAWGTNAPRDRARFVLELLGHAERQIWCLGKNRDGSPKHPLYVPYDAELGLLE